MLCFPEKRFQNPPLCQVATWHDLPVLARKVGSHPCDIAVAFAKRRAKQDESCPSDSPSKTPVQKRWIAGSDRLQGHYTFIVFFVGICYISTSWCRISLELEKGGATNWATGPNVLLGSFGNHGKPVRTTTTWNEIHVLPRNLTWNLKSWWFPSSESPNFQGLRTSGSYCKFLGCRCKIPSVWILSLHARYFRNDLLDRWWMDSNDLPCLIQSCGTFLNSFFSSNNSSARKMTHVQLQSIVSTPFEELRIQFGWYWFPSNLSVSWISINKSWTFRTTTWWPRWIQLPLSQIPPPFSTFTKPTGTAAGTAFAVADARGKPGHRRTGRGIPRFVENHGRFLHKNAGGIKPKLSYITGSGGDFHFT